MLTGITVLEMHVLQDLITEEGIPVEAFVQAGQVILTGMEHHVKWLHYLWEKACHKRQQLNGFLW